jgi:predicted CopG family antitoxin
MVGYTYTTRIEDGAMRKKLTITIAEDVYDGLHRVIGPRRISGFLETLARPHVVLADLDAAYAAMAADEARESEALEWAESAIGDATHFLGDDDEAW